MEDNRKSGKSVRSIDIWSAQCQKCLKWRKISSQEEYEEIRSKTQEDPFVCRKSCEDDEDRVSYDATSTWVIDTPGLPKTPRGFKRSLVLRKDYSKMDAYYIAPTGKKLRSRKECLAFLEANEDFKNAPFEDFRFTVPKVMEDTVPSKSPKEDN